MENNPFAELIVQLKTVLDTEDEAFLHLRKQPDGSINAVVLHGTQVPEVIYNVEPYNT